MDPADVAFAGAAEQAHLIRGGEVSAREVVQATLDRIARVDPKLNSYNAVFADDALATAAAIDERSDRDDHRPLLGVPVAVKDDTHVAGSPTHWGASGNDEVQITDAHIVTRLRAAGAIIIGKTTCSELTIQPFTETIEFGATHNPWNQAHTPGGSSGGSGAAVAAGLCGAAVGSDGLGSIRIPAAFNGVFGLKPHRDRIPKGPSKAGGWYGLSVVGPLTRRVRDAAVFMDATADDLPAGGYTAALDEPLAPMRIALSWKAYPPLSLRARLGDEQRAGIERIAEQLRALGHTVVEQEVDLAPSLFFNIGARYFRAVADDLATLPHPERTERRTRQLARMGKMMPGPMWRRSIDAEDEIRRRANTIFDIADVVLTPAALAAPWTIGHFDGASANRVLNDVGRVIPHFAPWNVIGQPAAVVPSGFDANGLPLAAQFYGRPHDEITLLRLAAQLEEATPWAHHRPNL